MIEDIEEFRAELRVNALGDSRILGHVEVGVDETRAGNGVAPEVAEVTGTGDGSVCARRDKGRDIAEPLRRIACRGYGTSDIRTERAVSSEAGNRCKHVQRVSGLGLEDRTELPAIHEAVALKRQFVEAAEDKAVTRIEVGQSPAVADVEAVLDDNSLRI